MIQFSLASDIVEQHAYCLPVITIDINDALNRVIASDVATDTDIPPFNKSAMDGYACRRSDLDKRLKPVEFIAAGQFPQFYVSDGVCSKIMTGAPVPDGADCVIPVENTTVDEDGMVKITAETKTNNISFKGEDLHAGEIVIQKGTLLTSRHIAALASVGASRIDVYKRPKVAVIVTGNELIEPGQAIAPGKIRNSNALQLISQLADMHIHATYSGIIKDDFDQLYTVLNQMMQNHDLVLLTGGVSMGDLDLVPEVMQKLGVEILFDSIAVQPGKPTTFGIKDNVRVFGLPGNPVSSYIQFELLVKPLIYSMMGCIDKPLKLRFPLAKDFTRRSHSRLGIFPVYLTSEQEVMPLEYHGSGHLLSLPKAFGVVFVEQGVNSLKKGELVNVRPFWQKY